MPCELSMSLSEGSRLRGRWVPQQQSPAQTRPSLAPSPASQARLHPTICQIPQPQQNLETLLQQPHRSLRNPPPSAACSPETVPLVRVIKDHRPITLEIRPLSVSSTILICPLPNTLRIDAQSLVRWLRKSLTCLRKSTILTCQTSNSCASSQVKARKGRARHPSAALPSARQWYLLAIKRCRGPERAIPARESQILS